MGINAAAVAGRAYRVRYREDINHFAHTDEIFVEACRHRGYPHTSSAGFLSTPRLSLLVNGITGFL